MAETDLVEINCGDALGIADVASMYTKLLDTVAEGEQFKINVSDLERVDAAAVQMLYALKKELSDHGMDVVWTTPSEAFKSAIELLGLAERMNIVENDD